MERKKAEGSKSAFVTALLVGFPFFMLVGIFLFLR
jgi:hypothetical protein